MPEMLVEDQKTGTKLRLDSDRQWQHPQGDSVMRVQSQTKDGGQFDTAYVECDPQEADLIAILLHEVTYPSPQTLDTIAQEVHAAFSSKLSGRDAAQIAQIVGRQWWQAIQPLLGAGGETEKAMKGLEERFTRAAAKSREPAFAGDPDYSPN